eukprot:1164524_1
MSEQFYLELQTAFEEQYKVEQPFTISYPCPNADAASAQTLINEIDERITTILEQAMEPNMALMTAFKEITFLVFTATNIIHESFPNENQILNYHHLLYHFAIYGCCLNKEYRKYMVPHPDVDHKPFKHLSQLLVQSTSRDKPTETRTTIIEQVAKHCTSRCQTSKKCINGSKFVKFDLAINPWIIDLMKKFQLKTIIK